MKTDDDCIEIAHRARNSNRRAANPDGRSPPGAVVVDPTPVRQHELARTDLNPGLGFGGTAAVGVLQHLHLDAFRRGPALPSECGDFCCFAVVVQKLDEGEM